jgi:hypothetical protein
VAHKTIANAMDAQMAALDRVSADAVLKYHTVRGAEASRSRRKHAGRASHRTRQSWPRLRPGEPAGPHLPEPGPNGWRFRPHRCYARPESAALARVHPHPSSAVGP